VTAGLDWHAMDRLTLSSSLRYMSLAFEDDQNIRRLAPGAELDLRAAWSLAPGKELYVGVENVADAKISTGKTADFVDSYSEPRTFRVGFSYRR
jgi:vitamin B12 transporter